MREHALLFDSEKGNYMIIFKDISDQNWSILDRNLKLSTAEMALKGLTA